MSPPSLLGAIRFWFSLWMFLALFARDAAFAQAQHPSQALAPKLKILKAILELPDEQIDLASVKLTIDHMIDPTIDVANSLNQLDAMAAAIKFGFPATASGFNRLLALQRYVYQAGYWNSNKPFRYDLDDPFGHNIRNKLLPTYLSTRKGNCVSMPILAVILGQKIGINLTLSTAPEHFFVKYWGDDGNIYNFEATSGGAILDASMQRQYPMSAKALSNGIYMQPLSKRESVVAMMGVLMEYYGQLGQEERRIAIGKLALEYNPKDIAAVLSVAAGYHRLIKSEFMSKYPDANDIPLEERSHFVELTENSDRWWNRAQALGWHMPDEKTRANYLKHIEQAKTARQKGE